MPRFEFRSDPAWVTVGEGLSLAFRQWRATPTLWAIPVLLVGILSTLFYWGIEAAMRDIAPVYATSGLAEFDLFATIQPLLPQFVVSTVVLAIITSIARWVYYGLAIAGLRGRELTAPWVVGRGLRTLVADLGVMLSLLAAGLVVVGVAGALGTGPGLVLGLAVACVGIYVQVRLAFWSLAIFDGAGIVEAAYAAWRASAGGVTRMVGWALAAAGVGFLVNIAASIATFPLSDAIPLQSGVKAGATEAFAVFQLLTMAVLYESQLRRTMPERASPPPAGYAEPTRTWPGYAPAAALPAWDDEPVNPGAPAAWDPKPVDPDAPDAPPALPQPPAPPGPFAGGPLG